MDTAMPHMDAMSTIRALQKLNPHVRIIVNTSERNEDEHARLIELGVHTVLVKPYSADKLLTALAEVITADRL